MVIMIFISLLISFITFKYLHWAYIHAVIQIVNYARFFLILYIFIFLLYMFYGLKLPGCNVGIRNKNKIKIHIIYPKMWTVLKGIYKYNSLEVVDQTNVRAVSGNDLSI